MWPPMPHLEVHLWMCLLVRLHYCRILFLCYYKCTFSVFFVVIVASFVSHFLSVMDVGALFSISPVSEHSSIVFVSIGIFDSPLNKLIILKSSLKLSSIFGLEITPSRSSIPCPLAIIRPSSKWEKPISIFFVINPIPIIVLIRIVVVCSISTFHLVFPFSLIYDFPSSRIEKNATSMLFPIMELSFIGQIGLFEVVLSFSIVPLVKKFSGVFISIWKGYWDTTFRSELDIIYLCYFFYISLSYCWSHLVPLWNAALDVFGTFFSDYVPSGFLIRLISWRFFYILEGLSGRCRLEGLNLIFGGTLKELFFGWECVGGDGGFVLEAVGRRAVGDVGHGSQFDIFGGYGFIT